MRRQGEGGCRALVCAWLLAGLAGRMVVSAQTAEGGSQLVVAAIAESVREAMGPDVSVDVRDVSVTGRVQGDLVVQPETGARVGAPARFLLFEGRTRVGTAVATVQASGRRTRALRELTRDVLIAEDDVEELTDDLKGFLLQRLPQRVDVVGSHAVRTVSAGETLTGTVVRIPPVVRLGDMVRATIRVGAVEVSAMVMAAGSGRIGDVVRVRGTATKQFLQARVTGRGAVEVIQ